MFRLSRLSLHQRLAGTALVLGSLAVVMPQPPAGRVTLDTAELARLVQTTEDHVRPRELADWILAGRSDYRLIDLRSQAEFAGYHIPGAENVPIAGLIDAGLPPNETLVLYSDGGIHAAQAWVLLRASGFRSVYSLLNGLDGWKEEVLFPVTPRSPTAEEARHFAAAVEVARHFGGAPRAADPTEGASTSTFTSVLAPPVASPGSSIAAPTLPSGAPRTSGSGAKPKKKEGC
ncbi:MAG: rhodanese-like domain-containing protein [Candidatus Eisenbacteria bacterium]|nr:rhodanese-like domain-containing protein [Candidatus Eisenbacteria bacterium]